MTPPAGRRVLLTGGTGMVGANLAHRLVATGSSVWVLSRPKASRERLRALEDVVRIVEADVTDEGQVRAAVSEAEPEIVFHLASTRFNPPSLLPDVHFRVNVLGTLNVLEALRGTSGIRVVYTGSAAEYGAGRALTEDCILSPGTVLGASKAAASLLVQTYARMHQMHTVVLRLFTPYGPWEDPGRLIPHTILSALTGRDVIMSRGDQQRDYVHIDDVVEALILAATRSVAPGSVFNIGSGSGSPVREVVALILRLMGNPVSVRVGALPTRRDEIAEMSGDISAARRELGWQPRVELTEGLCRSIAWFSEHREFVA